MDVGGEVTEPVVSDDLGGLSGIIIHDAVSKDPNYNGLPVDSIILRAMASDQAGVSIQQLNNYSQVDEGSAVSATYTIRLTAVPIEPVYLTISAPGSASEDDVDATHKAGTVTVSEGSGAASYAVVLVFDASNYDPVRTIHVTAIDA